MPLQRPDGSDARSGAAAATLSLPELCYLVTVADEQHFARAARRLHMDRGTLVRAVSTIEDQLRTELFERTGAELATTAAGRALAAAARGTLQRLAAPVADAEPADSGGTALRIGALQVLGVESVQLFLAGLHERVPDLTSQVSHAITAEQLRRLRARELDFGIVAFVGDEPGVEGEPVFAGDGMVCFAPVGGALAARRVLRPDDLRDEYLVMFPRSYTPALYDWWLTTIAAAGYRFRGVRHAGGSDPQDLVRAVSSGLGVVVASSGFVEAPGVGRLVVPRALEPPVATPEFHIVWLADEPPVSASLLASVRSAARDMRQQSAGRWFLGEPGEPGLTARELEVLQLAAHGLSQRRIAGRLVVSPGTVRTHFENIYPKLGVADKAGAVAEGLRRGLIE